MGIASGVAGLVGGLSGLFGGNSMPQAPPSFQMPNMGQAANNAFYGIGGLQPYASGGSNAFNTAGNISAGLQNNPYSSIFQQGGINAGNLATSQALGQYGTGAALTGAGIGALPYAQSIFNTAMDPQQQLYGYLQNQNTQQSNANLAAAGLATTPYGVGLTNQSNQLFNMNWQNAQLGREATGASAAGGLLQQAGGAAATGQGLMASAPSQYLTGTSMPYSVYNQLGNDQYANLSSYLGIGASGANLSNLPIQDYMGYLSAGNQANSVSNQLYGLQLQAQNQGFNQNMLLGAALGGGLYNIGRGMSGGLSSPFLGQMMPGSSFLSGNLTGL